MDLTERQNKVLELVKHWHGDQQRKYEPLPYWHHLVAVAKLVGEYENTDGAIEIALCHDLLEDTNCTPELLKEHLESSGYSSAEVSFIIDGVVGMTDVFTKESYPELNRRERKKREAERLGKTQPIVHTVKYADLIDNTRSIVEGDRDFARVYLQEMVDILDQIRLGNIHLLIRCCAGLDQARKELKNKKMKII